MKRKLLNRSFLKQTALAVPAAALMLGAAHGGTVGFNLDSYYYDNTGTATKWIPGATPAPDGAGYGYQTSGWVVTAKAFGVEPADWFYAQVFAWWGDSPVNVTTNKGTITAHITAFHCIETGIGEQLDGWIPQTVAPGNDQVTWNILTTLNGVSPSIHLSGLAANFPNGYVVQTITAARGATPQFDGVTFTDGVTPSHSDYTTTYYKKNVGTDGTAKDGTIGLSSPSRAYTSDTLQIQCDNQSAGRNSVLSGFIITDKPVASTPAYSLPFVPPGGTISLSPGVIGVPPMSYQWRTNGVPIPGATSATYTKTGANGADNANYDVVVINAYGSVTSEVATVTVDLPPAITWATPVTSAGDTDVSTAGTAVLAYDCNGTDQTVNGVSFTAVGSEVTLVGIGSNYKGFAAGTAPPATALSPDYLAVLTGGNYNDGGLATITLNNLIPEHQYQVQVWVNDSRNLNNGQNRTETVTSGGNTVTLKYPANLAGALGQYTIGTFTAKQSSQVITLLGNYSTQLNAIQMRDLGVVTVMPIFIPAPGSYIGPQLVAIHSGPGSTVYYTTDGTTPSSSSPHGASPVLVTLPAPATTTIKAYGTQTGQADSPVVSATYITYTTPAEPTWNNTAGGSWTVASNWVHNAIAGGANVTADFSQLTLTANTAVAFDSSPILGNLVLGDVGNKYSWTFGSGSLTLAATNPPTITVNNQAATINPPLSGVSGLTKTG
ncbi:MAG: chitobiase/beta-hexosaminidase C-terminal domain-containing protein, partial [Verrucomicrobia bacterium]|nr:chitobiase/beta-hexosaminidase C-terminal domain-containing protein [Verrucomicrobiota bacterium]